MRHILPLIIILASVIPIGCDSDDIGEACPELRVDNPGGGSFEGAVQRSEGDKIVEYSTLFPCENLVCVRTLGREAHCSKECSSDEQCPTGFACSQVTEFGSFVDRKYCVWATCTSDNDCGDPWIRQCLDIEELTDDGPAKLCAPR